VGYNDLDGYLAVPARITARFSAVPLSIVGKVSPGALELYAHIARRSGPDGWCWFAQRDFAEHVRKVDLKTYQRFVVALEDQGAVLTFNRWTTGKDGGRNGGFAFYRDPTLEPMILPIRVNQPTRVPGILTPRREGVSVGHRGSDVVRTIKDRHQGGISPALERDMSTGKFTAQGGISPAQEQHQGGISPPHQHGISPGAEVDPSEVDPNCSTKPPRAVRLVDNESVLSLVDFTEIDTVQAVPA
jgi:hypothetical protein